MMYYTQNNLKYYNDSVLKKKLKNLDNVYFMSDNSSTRQQIILAIDEVIIEMMKRGIYDKSIQRSI